MRCTTQATTVDPWAPEDPGTRRRVLVAVVVTVLVALVLPLAPGPSPASALPPPFEAHGSVNQVYVTGLVSGSSVELLDGSSAVIETGAADAQGALLFRDVPTGTGYQVRQGADTVGALEVTAPDDNPPGSFYTSHSVNPGYGYLTTRDGTTLSVNVTFPKDGSSGPWPVVVDYSGYDPSQPGDPPQEALPLAYQGYVVVGVNMRGTGCSGGSYNYFEMLQSLDGYDIVETVARQSWSNGDVGLVGISFPGISQLFVARTRPPHLRAITPLSVIADTYRSTLYPGGVLNTGFALGWAADRDSSAAPAAKQWARDRIDGGDTVCAANQTLRLQSMGLVDLAYQHPFYGPLFDGVAPRTFVDKIDVPVYIAGQFQDEQTGGEFSNMLGKFAPSTKVRATLTNGTHVEPLGPDQVVRLLEFVDFYVGKRIPKVNPLLRLGLPAVYQDLFDTSGATIPPDRFTGYPSYASALAAYEAEPPVRILWENGAGRNPGEPFSSAETDVAAWPVPGTIAQPWYLQPDGRLDPTASRVPDDEPRAVSSYRYEPASKPLTSDTDGVDTIWHKDQGLDWQPLAEGDSSSFVTAPFTTETAMAGTASADLWIRSSDADTDLEVTLTEVRPDGKERYIQSGWLRASHRALDPAQSTPLKPFQTHLEADASPLPAGEFVPVRVAIFPFAHVFRPGTQLRLNIESPGGNQPVWSFDMIEPGHPVTNDVGHSTAMPSKVVLPVLQASVSPAVPEALPACPSIRNQPCRAYLPARVPTDVVAVDDGSGRLAVTWNVPPSGGPVDAYEVTVSPTGEVITVPGDTTSLALDSLEHATPYTFTVRALYAGVAAPDSSASLSVVLVSQPTTTTTAPPTTTSPTAAPASTASKSTTGALPATGADSQAGIRLGLALLGVGGLLAALSRRRIRSRG